MALTKVTGGVVSSTTNLTVGVITATKFVGPLGVGVTGDGANFSGIVTATGLDINGNADVSGNLSVGGTVTYQDVTNVDSIGVGTFQSNVQVGAGISVVGVSTFSDNVITSGDVQFTGAANNAFWDKSVNSLQFSDNAKATWGDHANAGDLQIYHTGSHSYVDNTIGNLILQNDSSSTTEEILIQPKSGEQGIKLVANGQCEIYHDGNLRFYTTSSSVDVNGVDLVIPDKLVHSGDTNTAIRFPADDTFAVELGGDERLRITTTGTAQIKGASGEAEIDFMRTNAAGSNGNTFGKIAWLDNNSNDVASLRAVRQSAVDDASVVIGTRPTGGSITERLRIDSSGNIGAGTASPSSFSATDLVISKSANAGMTISVGNAGTTNTASIFFAEGTGGTGDKERGAIKYKHGDDYLAFHTDATERLRITSGGDLHVKGSSSPEILNIPTDASPAYFVGDSNRTGAGQHLVEFKGRWNGNDVARIVFLAGADTSNKDDGVIRFDTTTSGGSSVERLRIDSSGNVNFGANKAVALPSGTGIQVYNTSAPRIKLVNDTTGNGSGDGFQLYLSGSGVIFDHKENAEMRFYTNALERLRIASTGKIVASTNTTTTASFDYLGLHFTSDNSTVAEGLFINNIAANTGDNASISFSCDSGNRKKSAISHVDTGNYGRGDLVFSIDPDADSGELDIVAHEKLRILSTGRIGIGTNTAPRDMVHIHNPTANASSYIQFTNANTAGTGINDGTLIGISQNNSNTDGTGSGFTILNKENAEITLGTNGSEKLRISKDGALGIAGANYGSSGQVLTSQGGSAAPQWATAGGATVQSGSWTPAWTGHSGTPSAVDTAYGKYTRIGELVFIECYIKSGTRGSATGAIRVSGLPFDLRNDTHDQVLGAVAWDSSGSSIDYSGQNRADHVNMIAWIPNNTGYIRFAHQTTAEATAYRANNAGSIDLNWIICGSSSGNYLSFRFSGCYRTDA